MSTRSARGRVELLQGTLDLLILRTLRWGPAHGHAIAKAIEQGSDDVLLVEQGSLYPALHRLEKRGLLEAEWATSPEGRQRKHYQLTALGRKERLALKKEWTEFTRTVNLILGIQHVTAEFAW